MGTRPTKPAQRALRQQMVTGMEVMSAQLDRMEQLLGGQAGWQPPPPDEEPPPEEPEPATERGPRIDPEDDAGADEELSAMRERLAALEARLRRR